MKYKWYMPAHFLIVFCLMLWVFMVIQPVGADDERIHDHTSIEGGQLGMSGDFHIEFVAKKGGEYRLYVTDFLRKPVDITNAAGTLVINADGLEPEKLILMVDEVLQEFLVAQGRPRPENDTIIASASITIPGKEPIFIEFAEQIGTSWNGKDRQDGHPH